MNTVTLRDLPGGPDEVEAVSVRSCTAALSWLRRGCGAVTAAGADGALNIWKVPAGYRCERYRFRETAASATVDTVAAVGQWLAAEWPLIGDLDIAAARGWQ